MRLTTYTITAFQLNSALDSGAYDDIDVSTMKKHLDDGSVFDFLEKRMGLDMDLSFLDGPERAALLDEWQDMAGAISARRKFGVEHKGLALLLAYVLEGIQRHK